MDQTKTSYQTKTRTQTSLSNPIASERPALILSLKQHSSHVRGLSV